MTPRRTSFSFVLPLLAVALSLAIIAIPATLAYMNMWHTSRHGSGVTFYSHNFVFTVPHNHFFIASVTAAAHFSKHSIEALNTPAFSVQLLFDRFSSAWPMDWTPVAMDFITWRALIFPVYCLPFWWLVGLGVEGLLQRRLLRWPIYLLGTLLCIGFIVLFFGLTFGVPPEDRGSDTNIYLWGFALWALLFGVIPVAWLRQWRRSKRTPDLETPPPPTAEIPLPLDIPDTV